MASAAAAVAAPAQVTTAAPSRTSLIERIAGRFAVDANRLLPTLKATAFRQRADRKTGEVREPSNEEMFALLVIADQFRLNPFTKELFAFMDPKSGAIVPVVSVDGWIRIINEQPSLRSLEFRLSDETSEHKGKTVHAWMECVIKRSDRDAPIIIREYFDEVVRKVDFATPWDSHPNRMHRHKTLIQAARVAFGFGGIYDEDEASRIIDSTAQQVPDPAPAIAALNAKVTGKAPPKVSGAIVDGEFVSDQKMNSGDDTDQQHTQAYEALRDRIAKAADLDSVNLALDEGRSLPEDLRTKLADDADKRFTEIGG